MASVITSLKLRGIPRVRTWLDSSWGSGAGSWIAGVLDMVLSVSIAAVASIAIAERSIG